MKTHKLFVLIVVSILTPAAFIALTAWLLPARVAQAKPNSTITVNTLADNVVNDSFCSLREAITAANTNAAFNGCSSGAAGLDTITITATGTIVLGANLPGIAEDLNMSGPGSASLTISGNHARRVLVVSSGVNVNLSGVTIANGFASAAGGGGLYNSGTLTVTDSIIFNNTASIGASSGGGGVYNDGGTLTISSTTVYSNTGTSDGGGIYNYSGTVTLSNSSVYSNTATDSGGGIYNHVGGILTIMNSGIYSNSSGNHGGGIETFYATLNIVNSTVYSNSAMGGYGGGLFVHISTLDMTNSSIYSNTSFKGGAIYSNYTNTVNISNSTLYNNRAISSNGGGIVIDQDGKQHVTIANSTLFSNTAQTVGGGIYSNNLLGSVNIVNTTLAANRGSSGGNIYKILGTVTLTNTIIANSPATGNCDGTITDGGNNLQFGGTVANSCGSTIPTADPKLAPLGNYGGPTKTMALYVGSAAIDAGNDANCPATDQRGVARPIGAHCDIGAFEGWLCPPTTQLFLPLITQH